MSKSISVIITSIIIALAGVSLAQNPPSNLSAQLYEETGEVLLTWLPAAEPGEEQLLAYDDGTVETGLYMSGGQPGEVAANRFSPASPCRIVDVSAYVYSNEGVFALNDVWFLIWDGGETQDAPGDLIHTGPDFIPLDNDWNVYDVNNQNLNIQDDFWVGLAWTVIGEPPQGGPLLGVDADGVQYYRSYTASPPDYDEWLLMDASIVGFDINFMIRATVQLDNGEIVSMTNGSVDQNRIRNTIRYRPVQGKFSISFSAPIFTACYPFGTIIHELDELVEYIIYRDQVEIARTEECAYTDELPGYGIYNYEVTADWDPEGESGPANPAAVWWIGEENDFWTEDFEEGLPEDWSVFDIDGGGVTWELEETLDQYWLVPNYMWMDADAEGAGSIDYLITPPIDCSSRTSVTLWFDFYFQKWSEEQAYIEISTDGGGEWENVYSLDQTTFGTMGLNLSQWADEQEEVLIRFHYDDSAQSWGWYWGIDKVRLNGVIPEVEELLIAVSPWVNPTIIGPQGGSFRWDVIIENVSGDEITFDAWTEVLLPPDGEGPVYGPLSVYENLQLDIDESLEASPWQQVPGYAPGGIYTFLAKVGQFPQATAEASFQFAKVPIPDIAAQDGGNLAGWMQTGWLDREGEPEGQLTGKTGWLSLSRIYPNPFNDASMVEVRLSRSAEMRITVIDLLGREVKTLAYGHFSPGIHRFSFDACDCSSGIYFIRGSLPGEETHIRKVVLIR